MNLSNLDEGSASTRIWPYRGSCPRTLERGFERRSFWGSRATRRVDFAAAELEAETFSRRVD